MKQIPIAIKDNMEKELSEMVENEIIKLGQQT